MKHAWLLSGIVALSFAGCGGDDSSGESSGGKGGNAGSAGAGATGSGMRCDSTPPPGAPKPAAPPPYSGGTCPALPRSTAPVTIQSTVERTFILAVPANLTEGEHLPVIFLWHWMGGDASGFLSRGDVQSAVDSQRFIAVIPESKGSPFKWPFSAADTQPALDEELKFFDDMLSCVSEQFNVNENCVSTAGVSAGALWSGQLASYRAQYLSSFISLSGGTGGLIKPWGHPDHRLPAIVLWGGPTDNCLNILKFEETSKDLATNLSTDGHFFVECVHNCGHGEPPLGASQGSVYGALWNFVFDHPYWLQAGESPYRTNGLPSDMPAWCGLGLGSAAIRTGECPSPAQC